MDHYDVIIIGTGAGGGTLARKLAPSGKRILLLERGHFVPREKDNWSPRAVGRDGKYAAREVWHDGDGAPLRPHTNYNVGGNTKFYGAALFRLRADDFREVRHHGGLSPAWPITYEDLAPYYDEAEQLYHVHGRRGDDPTDPVQAAPFPHPPVSHEPVIRELAEDFSAAGLHPFHVPLGVMLNEAAPADSACIRCETCDGFPCLLGAKADAETCGVRPALAHPNVTLLTGVEVRRLETDPGGRTVTSVEASRNGRAMSLSADLIVVACGAINSAALLLRSASPKYPRGLANTSDLVGRHYMGHINSVLMAVSKCPNPTVFQKTLGINDFYFGSPDWSFPMGHISFVGKLDAEALRAGAPSFAPGWTLDMLARHSIDFWLTSEDLPDPENRVTLDAKGHVVLSYRPNNLEGHRRLLEALKATLAQRRACPRHGRSCHQGFLAHNLYLGQQIPLAGVAHQNGTLRFGTDPERSVLDVQCKAHDLDNLYVVDGSFFPSSGAVNPALTIIANALRVGDHLLDRLGQ
ncbi:MAG: GMC oxidoreductase [Vicinamibacterales bacterium]